MKIFPFVFITILLFIACKFNSDKTSENSVQGTWLFYDVEPLFDKPIDGDAFSRDAAFKKQVKDGKMFSLFKDGTYTDVQGDGTYKTARWKLSADKNSITFMDSTWSPGPMPVKIEKNTSNKQILILSNKGKNLAFKFIKESGELADFTSDPFYADNNKWRIRPSHGEDSIALTARLANYFKHLALVLKAAKERKQDVVSFQFSQGPVKIYNGGIGIHPYHIIPANWKKSFYNEQDAYAAYRNYEKYLETSGSYKGAASGDWVQDDYNILLVIYSDISQNISQPD